ncbi:MAG: gluconate 2-dehydrogenase subunit 3 family protein [Acidobacteria bacterium]|nr:gluconate 2-dehydrogenase subunit 3 family protein [Acidobacteriota bacterium]
MKRRKFFASAVAVPAAGTLLAQQGPPGQQTELPKLEIGTADDVASMQPKYFSASQFAALSRLAEILVPTPEAGVGAKEAKAAEFLDFLIGQSPADRQQVYLKGLDALIAQAKQKHQSSFEALSEAQANSLLEPLRKPWTYEPSSDPLTRFLQTAKADVRTATQNSKEFNRNGGGGARRPGGVGMYWYPLA